MGRAPWEMCQRLLPRLYASIERSLSMLRKCFTQEA